MKFGGNFVKIWYFDDKCSIKVRIYKSFCTNLIYIVVIICHTPHFVSIFRVLFFVKSPSVNQRSIFQEKAFKKNKNPSLFFFVAKIIGSNNYFTLIENNFHVFKIAKFEFKVTVHFSLPYGQKCTKL